MPAARRAMAAATAAGAALMTALLVLPVRAAGAQEGATTSTAPIDRRESGEIIPAPGAGREPQDPGDPGGWLQVSLFFLLVAAVALIVVVVWWQSRRARARRAAAGLDPVDLARSRDEGVRRHR